MNQTWCNGRWMDPAEFAIPAQDRGASHGLGIFETLLAHDGRIPFLDLHLARLHQGLERLGWPAPELDLVEIVQSWHQRHHVASGRVRLAITAGSGDLRNLAAGSDRLCSVTISPVVKLPESCRLMISPWRRNEHSPLAGLKCASYAENLIAFDHARRHGADEVLFLNTSGALCESAMANVFLVHDGQISTPSLDSGCLPGVARSVLLAVATRLGISCSEKSLGLPDVESADEIFLSSAVRGPVHVSRMDEREFSDSPVTSRLVEAWSAEVLARCSG